MIEKFRNIEMNELCLLIKERLSLRFATEFWFPESSCIYVKLHYFSFYLSAACWATSRYGQLRLLLWGMKMLFWQLDRSAGGTSFRFTHSALEVVRLIAFRLGV